jgi:hypothetical protein
MANFRTNLAGCSGRERRHSGRGSDDTIVFNFVYIFAMFCTKIHIPSNNRKGSLRVGYACNSFSNEVFMSMVYFSLVRDWPW